MKYTDPDGKKLILSEDAQPKQIAEYNCAMEYLMRSERASEIIKKLEESPFVFLIQFNDKDDDSYNYVKGIINWDSNSGLVTGNGDIQSAALGLIPEMGHAEQFLSQELFKLGTTELIESNNLKKTESLVADQLNEPKREHYFDAMGCVSMKNSTAYYDKRIAQQKRERVKERVRYYYSLYANKS